MKSRIEELAAIITLDEDGQKCAIRCLSKAVNEALEMAAKECENWGNGKVERLSGNDELIDSAKASAWDALQCASAIRKLKV